MIQKLGKAVNLPSGTETLKRSAALHCRRYLQDSSRDTCVQLLPWKAGLKKKTTNKEKQQLLNKVIEKSSIDCI